MLVIWLIGFGLEGLLYGAPQFWRIRRLSSGMLCVLIVITTLWLSLQLGPLAAAILYLLLLYRLGNMLRILKGRMHPQYLRYAAGRTSFCLLLLHAGAALLLLIAANFANSLLIFTILQAFVAVTMLFITVKNINKLHFKMPDTYLTDRELPTVTVAIPARNETDDLEACLHSVLASDYPKLEVIVLDDCSQAKTAEVIRSFAHDGVRFVPGAEPAQRWLAKNQAYQKLYEEASGDLILFCGVDVRFGTGAIRSMVNLMYARKKSMLSVMPVRTASSPAAAFIQPMRYWWELSLPRRLFNRPAVLSTCWMIGREDLNRYGGFAAVSHAILPEAFFARKMVVADQYTFVRSSDELRVETAKSFSEQYNTAIRTRYPQLRRRPENMFLLTTFYGLFLLLPFVLLPFTLWFTIVPGPILMATCLVLIATHVCIVAVSDPANVTTAVLTFPIVAASELFISYISMLQYEFFTVEWKDRNICIPVMHVIPKLPDIPEA